MLTTSSPAVACLASMVKVQINTGVGLRTRAQRTSASAVLRDPGGDIPPGHVNDTDRVTCQYPGPRRAVRAQTGVRRRRCPRNVGRAMVGAYWLILHTTTPKTSRHIRFLKYCIYRLEKHFSNSHENLSTTTILLAIVLHIIYSQT